MLGFASLITLGIIFAFVFVIIFLIANFAGGIDMPMVMALTVLFNFLGWLLSPYFMDFMYKVFYSTQFLDFEGVYKRFPELASFIKKICEKNNMKIPKFRVIIDDNPTAFCYGSGIFNARIAFSEGLFTYLNEDEREAVIAHEIGHIKRRDFIIMTIAATAVQLLYELYRMLSRSKKTSSDRKGGDALAYIALISYVFYLIGTYLLLFLSRVREYGADKFSGEQTGNPDTLARALVKIAYGIIAKPDTPQQEKLLMATRALGAFDPKSARHLGTAFASATKFGAAGPDWKTIVGILAYDLFSPWAKILELSSTHPLTGKRIKKLNEQCAAYGKTSSIDLNLLQTVQVDKSRLYKGFFSGVFIHFLPGILLLATLAFASAAKSPAYLLLIPGALGLGILLRLFYRYPTSTQLVETNTLGAMMDIYASPVRGKRLVLEGTIIGRGSAGAKLSEDLMLQDETGLLYLNYESAASFIGNLMFALSKVKKLIGQKVGISGWFFRDIGHHLDLEMLTTSGGATIKSHPKLWGTIGSLILIGITVYLFVNFSGNINFISM